MELKVRLDLDLYQVLPPQFQHYMSFPPQRQLLVTLAYLPLLYLSSLLHLPLLLPSLLLPVLLALAALKSWLRLDVGSRYTDTNTNTDTDTDTELQCR